MDYFHQQRQFKQAIRQTVASAQSASDLLPMMANIPLDKIKALINEHVDQSDFQVTTHLFMNAASIDQILPDDITQHILSFNGFFEPRTYKLVCHNWNKLSNCNESKYLGKVCKDIGDIKSPIEYNPNTSSTWIVDARRDKLIKVVLGSQGLINGDAASFQECASGDRILLCSGTYTSFSEWRCAASQFIGVGGAVVIKFAERDSRTIWPRTQVYFENITFEATHDSSEFFMVKEDAKLWLKNCRFKIHQRVQLSNSCPSIWARIGSSLHVDSCRFAVGSAVELSPFAADATVKDCYFEQDGGDTPCIIISGQFDQPSRFEQMFNLSPIKESKIITTEGREVVNFKCIGNVFENGAAAPIQTGDALPPHRCIIKNNSTRNAKSDIDPNTVQTGYIFLG